MNDREKNQAPNEFFFISELLDDKVIQQPKTVIGRLKDLEIKLGGLYPEVINLIVTRSFGRPALTIPFQYVRSLDKRRTLVDIPQEIRLKEFKNEPERILIKDMILDKRIIDTDEYEVEVVYDIHLLHTEGRMFVVHVDVSKVGMLRRLNLGWLTRMFHNGNKELELLHWRYVQALPSDISRFKGDVKLNVSWDKIGDIHPADLADILEELSGEERMSVFNSLDTETAADTLEETEPRVQRQLVATVRRERIIELLNAMSPAQIADILEILPRHEAEALKGSLSPEVGAKVNELLSQHEIRLTSIATNKYLALPETATVNDVLTKFRDKSQRYDIVMYVYVTTPDGNLKGVIDIREVIQAGPEETLSNLMTEQIVALTPDDTTADAAREFAKYDFQSLPMVDNAGKLIGAIRHKDILAVEE
ncbi:MAG: magnesium transporter [Desulfobacteraceae bacterium]|nr:MAG: magnesium transporter [Desulfobacteraceae bacterium]